MLALVHNVHLVGGQPWWNDWIGPVLALIAAGGAAWFAAKTANERQLADLKEDRELQKDRLEEDRALQRDQLAHDRKLRIQERQRDTLDDAVRAVEPALKGMARYESGIVHGDATRTEHRRASNDAVLSQLLRDAAREALKQEEATVEEWRLPVPEAVIDLTLHKVRLMLRFGQTHPAVLTYEGLRDACESQYKRLRDLSENSLSAADREAIQDGSDALDSAWSSFQEAGRKWFEEGEPDPRPPVGG